MSGIENLINSLTGTEETSPVGKRRKTNPTKTEAFEETSSMTQRVSRSKIDVSQDIGKQV